MSQGIRLALGKIKCTAKQTQMTRRERRSSRNEEVAGRSVIEALRSQVNDPGLELPHNYATFHQH